MKNIKYCSINVKKKINSLGITAKHCWRFAVLFFAGGTTAAGAAAAVRAYGTAEVRAAFEGEGGKFFLYLRGLTGGTHHHGGGKNKFFKIPPAAGAMVFEDRHK